MARPTGRSPRRRSVLKQDGVRDREVPHCGGCDLILTELSLPTLHHWEPGFAHVRKYPFAEPVFFCDECRVEHSLTHKSYVLVPMKDDQDLREALVAMLETLSED